MKFLQEVRNDSTKPKDSEFDAAFLSKQTKQKKKVKCFSCHQFGHIAPKCPQCEKPRSRKFNEPKAFFTGNATTEDQLIDSGVSSYMTDNRKWYKELKTCENPKIKIANNKKLFVESKGDLDDLDLEIQVNDSTNQLKIKDTLYMSLICR